MSFHRVHSLLPSQKNMLFELITQSELNACNFTWSTINNSEQECYVPVITYEGTDFKFIFNFMVNWKGQEQLISEFSPGEESMVCSAYANDWDDIKDSFVVWLSCLKRETTEPDLWTQMNKQQFYIEINEDYDKEVQFTYNQTLLIEQGINDVRSYVKKEMQLTQENVNLIDSKLDYLIDSSRRMNIKDWKNALLGVILTVTLTVPLNPAQGKIIMTLFQNAVHGIMKLVS